MPQHFSDYLEPKTSKIIDRIKAIDLFIEAGYDVHINFSPVIVYTNWLKEYEDLFNLVNENIKNKDLVKAEVIFLTHNVEKHYKNLEKNSIAETLIWDPKIQESKISEFGGKNLRYKSYLKKKFINQWTELHDKIIPWNSIRYCFSFLLLIHILKWF
jgi:spore photoproduct lyase